MQARELNGSYIGKCIRYQRGDGITRETGEITMITHKKNGNVRIRWGNGKETEVRADRPVQQLPLTPPVYDATLAP